MKTFKIPYGAAISLVIGSLRADTGLFVTPTFVSGDVTVQQDDGTGFETADDPTPGLDGTNIILDISAAEASPPAILNGRRIFIFKDQDGPVWLDEEVMIVTTDHHLAAEPNGVFWKGLGSASNQGASSIALVSDAVVRAGYFFIVTAGTGAGQAGYVSSYSAANPYIVTPVANLDTVLDGTSVIAFYVDRPAWLTSTQAQAAAASAITAAGLLDAAGTRSAVGLASASLDAQLGAIDNNVNDSFAEMVGNGSVTTGASTTVLPLSGCVPTMTVNNQFKGGILKFKKDTTTAALRNVSARILSCAVSGLSITLVTADALPATPADGDTFWLL